MAHQKTLIVEQGTENETKADLTDLPMHDMESGEFYCKWERVNKFVPLQDWQDDIEDNKVIAGAMQSIIEGLRDCMRDAHVDIFTLVDNTGAAREIYRTAVIMPEGQPSIQKGQDLKLSVRGHNSGYTISVNDSNIHIGCWDHADIILTLTRPGSRELVYVSLRLAVLKSWKTGHPISSIIQAIRANLPR